MAQQFAGRQSLSWINGEHAVNEVFELWREESRGFSSRMSSPESFVFIVAEQLVVGVFDIGFGERGASRENNK